MATLNSEFFTSLLLNLVNYANQYGSGAQIALYASGNQPLTNPQCWIGMEQIPPNTWITAPATIGYTPSPSGYTFTITGSPAAVGSGSSVFIYVLLWVNKSYGYVALAIENYSMSVSNGTTYNLSITDNISWSIA